MLLQLPTNKQTNTVTEGNGLEVTEHAILLLFSYFSV